MRITCEQLATTLQKRVNGYVTNYYEPAKAIGDIESADAFITVAADFQRDLLAYYKGEDPTGPRAIEHTRNLVMFLIRKARVRDEDAPVPEEAIRLSDEMLDIQLPDEFRAYFEAIVDSRVPLPDIADIQEL